VNKKYILKIFRGTPKEQYWEEFEFDLEPMANIISSLMHIQKSPLNRKGEKVLPVAWEQGCLEEVCGSCSMLINGRPRQACTALIEPIIEKTGSHIITVAPFTKFPLIRDLVVDRSKMFENLKKVHAWIETDGLIDRGRGPLITQEEQELMYSLATCMTCGCCVEACPQAQEKGDFLGAQIFSQVRLFNAHPTGKNDKNKRLEALTAKGGISDCGNAQNCVRVCPKNIPLTESIAAIGRALTIKSMWG
jgi:succinate dehydrogenase / fumarate reductase, iron-sulfur subunit